MNYHNLRKIVGTQFDCISENYLENSELNCSTAKRIEIPTYYSIFLEILNFAFLSEIGHRSFCVEFSCLISQLRILEKS